MTLPPHALESLATLVGWLLTYLVHSTLLLGGAWLLTRSPRVRRAAQVRDAIWRVALLGGLATTTVQGAIARAPLAGEWRWRAPTKVEVRSELHRAASVPTAHDGAVTVPRMRVTRTLLGAWRAWLAVAWIGGAIAGVALLVAGHRRAMAPIARRDTLAGTRWERAMRRAASRMGVPAEVRLTTAASLASPVAIGASEICLPRRVLAEFADPEIEAILAHELAHLARRDPWWLAVARLLERVAFFQPLHVVARRELQELAELRADDAAAHATGGGRWLAGSLVRVAGWIGPDPTPIRLVAMAEPGGSALVRRVERLLATTPERAAKPGNPVVVLAFATVALALVAATAPRVEAGWQPLGAGAGAQARFFIDRAGIRARSGAPGAVEMIVVRSGARERAGRVGPAGRGVEGILLLEAPTRSR